VSVDSARTDSPGSASTRNWELLLSTVIEFIATGFLLIAVVGSGIMAERLSGGNTAIALLANALATGFALVALILAFGPISGAHMNPVVTLAAAMTDGLSWGKTGAYFAAQFGGALAGVWLSHLMFELPIIQTGHHVRTGTGQWLAETVASFGLLAVIWGCRASRAPVTAFAVGAYIAGAYWFTASTSFANPAVTVARALTDSFAGIRPVDAPEFVLAQFAGLLLALPLLFGLSRPAARGTRQ
jgi:glycerol uptake facilitator-like aquaporin